VGSYVEDNNCSSSNNRHFPVIYQVKLYSDFLVLYLLKKCFVTLCSGSVEGHVQKFSLG